MKYLKLLVYSFIMVLAGTGATGAPPYNIPHPSIEYVVEEQNCRGELHVLRPSGRDHLVVGLRRILFLLSPTPLP